MGSSRKKALLFDYYSDESSPGSVREAFAAKMERLKQNKVKTVFLITSKAINLDLYLELVNLYEKNGLPVTGINIESLDDDHLLLMKNAVEDIDVSRSKASCIIISFGMSYAGALLACYYTYSGHNLQASLEKVREINKDFMRGRDEIDFVRSFLRYAGIYPDPLLDDNIAAPVQDTASEEKRFATVKQAEILPDHDETDKRKKENKKENRAVVQEKSGEDRGKPDANITGAAGTIPDDKRFGKFYSSIRFKLITITSMIVIISLSGMIFLATYFFKKDNTVRVNENTMYVSEVIALKIRSDFQAIIDKSRLIASALQNSGNTAESYAKLILKSDRDFIFFGIASRAEGKGEINFVRKISNDPVMAETQITGDDIAAAHITYGGMFADSFNGEMAIRNISQGFRTPSVALSIPFRKDNKGIYGSILICYIKLDRFLEAFQSEGVTKAFMVNSKGDILAHFDSRIVLGGGSYINLPIVKEMIKSSQSNGQQRYMDEKGLYHLGSFHKIGIGGCGIIATVSESVAYQEVYRQQRRNGFLTVIVLTVVILIIYFFGKTITTPIIRLLGATKKIKNGDYNVTIKPSSHDEIGELTNAFVDMGHGLEEREKIKTTFGKFVDPELVERLTSDSELKLGGERKTVAVMFSDIRDFTSISEKLQPEEVVEFLNVYLTKMVGCIDRTGGIVDKFIGDAIMAEWGALVSRDNDTEMAVNGALMMREVLLEFNKERKEKNKPLIKFGCGINTGPVLAGQIGSEDRMEYTVIGDAVNLASRIEGLNKPFGTDILISEDSYKRVKDIFAVEKMAPIKVKGKEESQQIYAVLGRLDDPKTVRSITDLRDLIGSKEQPFRRRKEDNEEPGKPDNDMNPGALEEEVKYEILA